MTESVRPEGLSGPSLSAATEGPGVTWCPRCLGTANYLPGEPMCSTCLTEVIFDAAN